ncbi:MAG: hypothetical protein KKD00_03265 [Gammaproteobacteria bacterium]|nr:hypothetical protein [Gammaproteobacteria bacterium]
MKPRSGDSQTEAGQSKQQSRADQTSGPDLIDAINQVFAEFELAYHNQYHKAYADQERLVLAKKYWLQCLSDFYPMQLVAAARRLVKSQDYLPTISAMIRMCEQTSDLFGLPSERDAYTEACRAPAPKALHKWSHPAVYFAGKATDWFLLATEPEDKVYPLFCFNYRQLCERVMRGEELSIPVTQALQDNPSRPLSYAERQARMQDLRRSLDV